MPELPEVEAVCRRLRRDAVEAEIASVQILRPAITKPQRARTIETRLAGQKIIGVRRRGKNILIDLTRDIVHIHLRMTGDLVVIPDARFRTTAARAIFEFTDGRALVFNDPRALGKLSLGEQKIDELGVEPLAPEFTAAVFEAIARKSRSPVKVFLLDQRRVAGIGNIYASEALYRARIDPRKPVGSLSKKRLAALHAAIVDVLTEAVGYAEQGYLKPALLHAPDEFVCAVYGRDGEPCNHCGRPVRRIVQGGRSTYFCPRCQR